MYSTSLLESVDAASVEVSPMLAKAYERVQNGSDIRGVAIAGGHSDFLVAYGVHVGTNMLDDLAFTGMAVPENTM